VSTPWDIQDYSLDGKSCSYVDDTTSNFHQTNEPGFAHTVVDLVFGLAACHYNTFTVDTK
jgi:hypothetical protein